MADLNGSVPTSELADAPDARPGTADHEYNCRLWAPEHAQTLARHRALGASARDAPGVHLDLRWGALPRQTLDIFLPQVTTTGALVVHVHGGYWQYQTSGKDGASFLAPAFVAHDCAFVALQYALCPEVSMDGMVQQMRQALDWVWRKLPELGYQPRRTVLVGHSAGAHLVATLGLTDWSALGHTANPIAAICGISGLYDLHPLVMTYLNRDLRMDPTCAARNSPINWVRSGAPATLLAYGGRESESFAHQTRDFARSLGEHGADVTQWELDGYDHFSAIEVLTDASHPVLKGLLAHCKLNGGL